jgi:hypothetical protein
VKKRRRRRRRSVNAPKSVATLEKGDNIYPKLEPKYWNQFWISTSEPFWCTYSKRNRKLIKLFEIPKLKPFSKGGENEVV